MRADQDDFVRLLATANLADGVPLRERVAPEDVRHRDFNSWTLSVAQQAMQLGVGLVADHELRIRRDLIRRSAHRQQPEILRAIDDLAGYAFGGQELRLSGEELALLRGHLAPH